MRFGNRPVQGHDRGRRHLFEPGVESRDLGPVGFGERGGFRMQGAHGSLHLIGPGPVPPERRTKQMGPFHNPGFVPEPAILRIQGDHFAFGAVTGGAAGIVQQHQGQQAARFGLQRQSHKQSTKADSFLAQIRPDGTIPVRRRVAFIEDQIDGRQNGVQAFRQLRCLGDLIRDPGFADLALCPDQPLGHRRFRHQKRPRSFTRRQAAQGPQRECYLCRLIERWITVGKNQPEAFIGNFLVGFWFGHGLLQLVDDRLNILGRVAHGIAAQPVDCLSPRCRE